MLIKEPSYEKQYDPLSLLESMDSMPSEEGMMCASMVPVIETPSHKNMVFYRDLLSLSEDTSMSIDESLDKVIQDNYMSKRNLVVAIEEWRPMVEPELVNKYPAFVLFKESINSLPYRVVNEVMSNYMEDGDEFWFDVLKEAMLNEEFAVSLLEDKYRMNNANLQGMINSTQHQINTMGTNNPNTANLQKQLKDMQSAMTVRQNMAKSRASDQAGIPQNTAVRTANGTMSKEEQEAKKAEIKARMEANKNNPKPNLAGTGGPAAQIKSAKGSPNNPNPATPTPTPTTPPTQQQQGWASRIWSSIKNWFSNTFSNGGNGATTPSNPYGQAAAATGKDAVYTGIDRGQAWLANQLEKHGINPALADMLGGMLKGKSAEQIDKWIAQLGG